MCRQRQGTADSCRTEQSMWCAVSHKAQLTPSWFFFASEVAGWKVSLLPQHTWADTHLLPGCLWLELQREVHGDVWVAQGTVLGGIGLWPAQEFHEVMCARLCPFLFGLGRFLFHGIRVFKCQLHLKRRKQNVWFFNKANIILFIYFNKGTHALTGIARSAQDGDGTSEQGQTVRTVSSLESVASSLHSGGTYISTNVYWLKVQCLS